MEAMTTITIKTDNGASKGFVLVREDGTLADQIQDCTADLPEDVYAAIELAISGETLGKRAIEGEGEGYSFVVDPLPPTVHYTICALDLDPNDGHAYDLNAVADEFARCLRAQIEGQWTGAGELATIRIERHQTGGASQVGEYSDGAEVSENLLDAVKEAAFESIDWAACEVEPEMSITETHPQTDGGTRFVVETRDGVEIMVTQDADGDLSAFTRPGTPDSDNLCQAAMDFVREQAEDDDAE